MAGINESNFLEIVSTAIEAATGKKTALTDKTYLKADLNLESIDFVDVAFEIERKSGIEIDFRELLLAGTSRIDDLQVQEIITHLIALSKKK